MDNDDRPVGRLLTRREALALLGSAGVALLAACANVELTPAAPTQGQATATTSPASPASASPTATQASAAQTVQATGTPLPAPVEAISCVVRPEMTEGPYFIDTDLDRSDIRGEPSDNSVSEGLPLNLAVRVTRLDGSACLPVSGAQVDLWHCDAQGVYSGVSGSTGKFLRGYQFTGEDGLAQFTTIYPGWYPGRAVHIHFKIRATTEQGNTYEFTSQFFFDDTLSDQVFSQAPYAVRGERNVRNPGDGIYRSAGDQLTLNLSPTQDGYETTFNIALDFSDAQTGQPDGFRGG